MTESFLEKVPRAGGLVRFDHDVVGTDTEAEAEVEGESADGKPAGVIAETALTFGEVPAASSVRFRVRREA